MKLRPITSLAKLTPEQIALLSDLLQTHSYKQVQKYFHDMGMDICITTLSRFYHRDCERRELAQTAKAILDYEVTGEARFDEAAIAMVKQTAFETALARREERAYRGYVSDEQRGQAGCPARKPL